MDEIRVGYALSGSFCTFDKSLEQMKALADLGYQIIPIFSQNACRIDTRFGKAADFVARAEQIAGRRAICTIADAEPIGPKKMTDIMVVAPCTGNTLGKLALGITDTTVTMAVKSHLRGGRPVLIAVSTNDALGASAQNVGRLLNVRHMFFVPFAQDAPHTKPTSLVARFELLPRALEEALKERQLQPMVLENRI